MGRDRIIDFFLFRVFSPVRLLWALFLMSSVVLVFNFSFLALMHYIVVMLGINYTLGYFFDSNSSRTTPDCTSIADSYWIQVGKVHEVILGPEDSYSQGLHIGIMYYKAIRRIIPKLAQFVRPDPSIQKIVLPANIADEVKGMSVATNIPIETFIRAYLIADKEMACTTVTNSTLFARNVDWNPFDVAHESILVRYPNGSSIFTIPGFVCGPTMWNKTTVAAVNASPQSSATFNPSGLPILVHFRMLFEKNCDVSLIDPLPMPRHGYHYTQQKQGCDLVTIEFSSRPIIKKNPQQLVVLNFDEHGNSGFNSYYRRNIIQQLDSLCQTSGSGSSDARQMAEQAKVMLEKVQSWVTCHSIIVTSTHCFVSCANGYSASGPFARFDR